MSVSRGTIGASVFLTALALAGCQADVGAESASTSPEVVTTTQTVTATPNDTKDSEDSGEGERGSNSGRVHGPNSTRSGLTFDTAVSTCETEGSNSGIVADWDDGLLSAHAGGDVFILKAHVKEGGDGHRNVVLCKVRGTNDNPELLLYKLIN